MPWHEVIGVIQDVREKGLQEKGAGNRVLAAASTRIALIPRYGPLRS